MSPDDELESKAGMTQEALASRSHVRNALWNGPRSDFGLSLTQDGRLLFGVGHRDFYFRKNARPVRDVTFEAKAPAILDDEWHAIAAVRTARELALYVDGRKLKGSINATGGADGEAAFAAACQASKPPHALHDATHFVALGQLFTGRIRKARIQREGIEKPPEPIQVHYMAHADNGSRVMRDKFVASFKDPLVELKEFIVEKHDKQAQRYGAKGQLIQRALDATVLGGVVVVSDLDIRLFKTISDIIAAYADADAVFQRDEDWSLTANLGFMALRNTERVRLFFEIVCEMAHNYSLGLNRFGGDQRIVNAALRGRYPSLPEIKWALFPTELMTRSISQQRGLLYASHNIDVLFHVNDFGSNDIAPDKARKTKLALLEAAEKRVRQSDV